MFAVAAVRLAHSLLSKPPPQGMTEPGRIRREEVRVRPWPIAGLPDGERGRLVGTARGLHGTLIAPLSGRPCLYYVVLVKSIEPSGARDLFTERKGIAFALEDTSGSAIIDPARASAILAFDHRDEVYLPDLPSPAQRALLLRNGHSPDRSDQLRFVEAVLSIGERTTVVGTGFRRPDIASPMELDYRSAPPPRLQLAASDATPLFISSQYLP
jgi:hypothetical protein